MTAASVIRSTGGEHVVVASRLFGPLSVPPDSFLTFPAGMPGFTGEHRFVLLPAASQGIYWLQSIEVGSLAFLLVDPFMVFPDYAVELAQEPGDAAPPLVLAIVTLPRDNAEPCTANLQAPLAIHLAERTGRQLILGDTAWTTRHPFDLRARLGR